GTGSGTVSITNTINNMAGITENAANSTLFLSANNGASGNSVYPLTILSGTVQGGGNGSSNSPLGHGALQLGDTTAGNAHNALLLISQTAAQSANFNTSITVAAGSSGNLAIESQTANGTVPTTSLIVNNNLLMADLTAGTTLGIGTSASPGVVTGASNITIGSANAGTISHFANSSSFSGGWILNGGVFQFQDGPTAGLFTSPI